MRRIGTLDDSVQAQKFCDYLVTKEIDATWDDQNEGSDIWIREESAVETARQELAEFRQDSSAAKYQVGDKVRKIREQRVADNARRQKNMKKFSGSRTPGRGLAGFGSGGRQSGIPLTIGIIVLSILASVGTNFGRNLGWQDPALPDFRERLSGEAKAYLAMSFVDRYHYVESDGDSLASIKKGQLWRLVTPMFLHGGTMHLLFNMLWIYSLGSSLERLHGTLAFAGLVVFTEIIGMAVQVFLPDWMPAGLRGSPFAIGASGAVYGLFGFIWMRPRFEALYPIVIPQQTALLMLGWLVLCMTPIIPNVANGAHLGGLLGGVIAAYAWPGRVS